MSANDTTKETDKERAARVSKEAAVLVPANSPESVELANCIEKANVALAEKAEVLARIQSSRELATLLTQNGSGSREQVEWVLTYLPRKKRKAGEAEDEAEDES